MWGREAGGDSGERDTEVLPSHCQRLQCNRRVALQTTWTATNNSFPHSLQSCPHAPRFLCAAADWRRTRFEFTTVLYGSQREPRTAEPPFAGPRRCSQSHTRSRSRGTGGRGVAMRGDVLAYRQVLPLDRGIPGGFAPMISALNSPPSEIGVRNPVDGLVCRVHPRGAPMLPRTRTCGGHCSSPRLVCAANDRRRRSNT